MEPKKNEKEEHVAVAAPPEPPKPYPAAGYPKPVFSKAGNAPPRIVNNDDELKALDPAEWTTIPPQKAKEGADIWPKLYADVNILPQWISTPEDAAALGSAWREFPLPVPGR